MNMYIFFYSTTIFFAVSTLQASQPDCKKIKTDSSIQLSSSPISVTSTELFVPKINIDRRYPVSDSLLRKMFKYNEPQDVIKYLENNPHLEIQELDNNGNSLLHHAKSPEHAKLLIDYGLLPYIDDQNHFGKTPLYTAVEKKNKELIKFLLHQGAGPFIKNYRKQSPFVCAILHNDFDFFNFFIEQCPEILQDPLLEFQDDEGKTPLIHAVEIDNTRIIHYLLKHFTFDIDKEDMDGCTALHHVKSTYAAYLLVQSGMVVNMHNKYGQTPLRLACLRNVDSAIIDTFIAAGGDNLEVDRDGNTLLHATRNVSIANILLRRGANINAENGLKKTPLHLAVKYLNPSFANYLISQKANIHALDRFKRTPLHYARTKTITKKLLTIGANPHCLDYEQNIPIYMRLVGEAKVYWADTLQAYLEDKSHIHITQNNLETLVLLAKHYQSKDSRVLIAHYLNLLKKKSVQTGTSFVPATGIAMASTLPTPPQKKACPHEDTPQSSAAHEYIMIERPRFPYGEQQGEKKSEKSSLSEKLMKFFNS